MKSESDWKVLVISVVLLIVASVVVAVVVTSNSDASSALNCKNPKLSTEVSDNIPPPGIAPSTEPMTVNIYLTENKAEYIDELRNYTIDILYIKGTKVVAEIYTDQILEIKNLAFVTYVETTLMDIPLPVFPEVCSVKNISEGVKCLDADTVRNSTGKDVKVAIIDGGFSNYKQCLPEENIKEVKSYGLASDPSSHGTACAEIVLQVAPDAELYLINCRVYDMLDKVVENLTTWNVDIVTRSLGQCWGLFDGTDEVCTIIEDTVFNHGIVWVNAAGNCAEAHWEGTFNDSDGDGWHEFPGEGGELGQMIYVNPDWPPFRDGYPVTLYLSWNGSWNNETQDYDIYIFDESRKAVARSIDPQMGLNGHKSFEAIEWMPASRGRYSIVIRNCNATKPVHFELYLWPWGTAPSCNVEKSSLCADATARGVIAAGAVDQGNNIEDYSSRGATNDGRIKPDFVAPVGYDTCAYSGPFSGTSASSPHIAGELALLLSWIRETQPQQNGTAYELIKPYLDNIANTTEPDNQYGYGLFPECYNSS
jgi:subtilisin family serine protease